MPTPLMQTDVFQCPVCDRECDWVEGSRHHVLPKSQGGRETQTICRDCHRQIHRLFTVKELARQYKTLEALKVTPEMQTWIHWVRKRPARRLPRPSVPV